MARLVLNPKQGSNNLKRIFKMKTKAFLKLTRAIAVAACFSTPAHAKQISSFKRTEDPHLDTLPQFITVAFILLPAFLPGIANAVTVFPGSATAVTGSYLSGNASSLAGNDNVFYRVNSTTAGTTRTAAWYGSFPGIPNNLANLNVNYSGNNSRNCRQTIAIWSWASNAWVQLNSRTVGTAEIAISNLIPSGALADYVSGVSGNGQVRVRVRCQTSANFINRGDVMSVVYTLPNTPPTISAITDKITNKDTATGAIVRHGNGGG
jgi:hypothetical protein